MTQQRAPENRALFILHKKAGEKMYKIITPVATEPVSLAEVKQQLRLNSGSPADDVVTYQSLAPASRAANTYTGTAVDVLGKTAIVNLNSGTNQATGTVDAHIEESDDNITFTDWTGGTFTQVTTANDNAVYEKQYTGAKQYIRVVAVVALAACEFGVDVVVYSGDTAEDTLLASYITAAREYGEDITRRAFATQTIEMLLDEFPAEDYIELSMPPLQSVTSVKYKDSAGTETTMTATTEYLVDTDSNIGRVGLPTGVSWPSFIPYPFNPIKIRYVAGYTTLPSMLKNAILLHIGYMYKYRDSGIPAEDMKAVNNLYNMRRAGWF
jgi:uncharacterized phiE125 gp8 family phage protein